MSKSGADNQQEGNVYGSISAGVVSCGFTLWFLSSLGFGFWTWLIVLVSGGLTTIVPDRKLQQYALIFGATATIAVAHEQIIEIPEKLAENPISLATGAAAVAGWCVTKQMLDYERMGEDVANHHQNLTKQFKLIELGEGFKVARETLKSQSTARIKMAELSAIDQVDAHIAENVSPRLRGYSRSKLGLPVRANEKDWEDEIPLLESASSAEVSSPVVTSSPDRPAEKLVQKDLPDGAKLIQIEELADNNRYPVVMVVAGQGTGKTATMTAILSKLPGKKAINSPKPLSAKVQGFFDLVFGKTNGGEWLNYGKMDEQDFEDSLDLTALSNGAPHDGSTLAFLWAARRESMNRQLGKTPNVEYWRCFFDEASYTFLSGYNNPLDSKGEEEKRAKAFISGVQKDAFQNFRGQKIQWFVGAQSESVDSIGLRNFSEARDEAWHLYPGTSAIECAKQFKKFMLANWLQRRINEGKGVALLEKRGVFFEVIDLPTIAELRALTDASVVEAERSQPQAVIELAEDDEIDEVENAPAPTTASDPIGYVFERVTENPTDSELKQLWAEATGKELNPLAVKDLRNLIEAKRGNA